MKISQEEGDVASILINGVGVAFRGLWKAFCPQAATKQDEGNGARFPSYSTVRLGDLISHVNAFQLWVGLLVNSYTDPFG